MVFIAQLPPHTYMHTHTHAHTHACTYHACTHTDLLWGLLGTAYCHVYSLSYVCLSVCVSVQTGANPIHGAAMNGHAGAVRVLTRSGCNIDQQRKVRGMTVVRGHET